MVSINIGRAALAAALVGLAGVLGGCDLLSNAYTYRYRVTVEVDTPQGLRSGSSVWETSVSEGSGIPDRSLHSRQRGEAVAVDLPGGTLFALLRGADMNVDYAAGVIGGHLSRHPEAGVPMTNDWAENKKRIIKAKPAFELSPDEYPLLVRFRDINDPASVEKVDPADLSASFGPGVRLKRITVSVTDDDVTGGIEQRLRWLPQQRGAFVKLPMTPQYQQPLAARLTEGDFSQGDRK